MKLHKNSIYNLVACTIALAFFSQATQAATNFSDQYFNSARRGTIHLYLQNLQQANATQMTSLFVPGGTVLSTSKGEVAAGEFFAGFLPNIETASVNLGSIYRGVGHKDRYSASFSFHWKMKDGSQGGGSYSDEFYFAPHSKLLQTVIMYENTN